MDSLFLFLIAIAAVLLLGALGEVFFQRTGVPSVLWLLGCGLLLGPILGLVPREQTAQLAPYLPPIAIAVVFFEIGGRLRFDSLARTIQQSGPLAGLSFLGSFLLVFFTSSLAHLAGLLPETFSWSHALLLSAILAASCSFIMTPVMARARLSPSTSLPIEQASSLSSVASVILVAALLAILDPVAEGFLASTTNLLISFSLGLGLGLIGAVVWTGFIYALRAPSFSYLSTTAIMLVLYALAVKVGAAPLLTLLVFTLLIAHVPFALKHFRLPLELPQANDLLGHRRLLRFLLRSTLFLFVGLVAGPPWDLLFLGVLLALVLIPARLLAVLVSFKVGGWQQNERPLAIVSAPRGLLAVALALLPLQAGIPGSEVIPVAIFSTVLISLAIYGITFPLARGRLIPSNGNENESPVIIVAPDEPSRRSLPLPPEESAPPRRPLPPPVPPPPRRGQ